MAKLPNDFFGKVVVKIIEDGDRDDLAKFILSGNDENIVAVKSYFEQLEIEKKRSLWFRDDTWFLDIRGWENQKFQHSNLSIFQMIAPSIIPYVKKLHLINTHLNDYSFLKDIKYLYYLSLDFDDDDYIEVLTALSSLKYVSNLILDIKDVNLQFLAALSFSFNKLVCNRFIFEDNPVCDKLFEATNVELYGDNKNETVHDVVLNYYSTYKKFFPQAYGVDDFFVM